MHFVEKVFLYTISNLLIFSGCMKVLSYRNTITSIANIGIFPKKYSKIIGVLMPIMEIILGFFIIFYPHMLVIIAALGYAFFFIVVNLKFTIEGKSKKCCCYGKVISSKLGKGGIVHYIYFLVILLTGKLLCLQNNTCSISIDFKTMLIAIVLSILLAFNGILIRVVIEEYIG